MAVGRLDKPLIEAAPLLDQQVVEMMRVVLHDVKQFVQNPPLHNQLQEFQRNIQNIVSLLDTMFIQFVASPADSSKDYCTGHNRRVKHPAAHH